MKIKKKSIIIPAFALLIGTALAGSISGTVAWYQFSTRVNAGYVGVSGGTSGNLQLRIGDSGEWLTRLTWQEVESYIAGTDYASKITPITSGPLAMDEALGDFYANPVYGKGAYSAWQKAEKANYFFLPLQLRYVERDGIKENDVDAKNIEKEVFLSDLLIQEDHTNAAEEKADLSEAIRFHICAYQDGAQDDEKVNRLISKKGGTTLTEGKLDLDGDAHYDYFYNNDPYNFNDGDSEDIIYGDGEQVSFSAEKEVRSGTYYDSEGNDYEDAEVYPMIVENVGETLDIDEDSKEYKDGESKSIGSTVAAEDEFLNVEITIWVEGWQTFENGDGDISAIWDEDYIQSKFNVGFEFAVDIE